MLNQPTYAGTFRPLNESPSEKEGKSRETIITHSLKPLNESPSEKEGKF